MQAVRRNASTDIGNRIHIAGSICPRSNRNGPTQSASSASINSDVSTSDGGRDLSRSPDSEGGKPPRSRDNDDYDAYARYVLSSYMDLRQAQNEHALYKLALRRLSWYGAGTLYDTICREPYRLFRLCSQNDVVDWKK
jgi:hypothetical protein